jgi:type II secretion system protein G
MRRSGFTLVELLIVITVISILALIVIPKLMGASRQAREAVMKANLQRLRSAIAQFQADAGVYPASLDDLVATTPPTTGAGGATIPPGSYKGPYLNTRSGISGHGLPQNPFIEPTDTNVSDHWTYETADGTVISAVTGSTLDGVPFSDL